MAAPAVVIETEKDGSISYVEDSHLGYAYQNEEIPNKWLEDCASEDEQKKHESLIDFLCKPSYYNASHIWIDGQPFVPLGSNIFVAVSSESDDLAASEVGMIIDNIEAGRSDFTDYNSYWIEDLPRKNLNRQKVVEFLQDRWEYILDFNEIDYEEYREKDWTIIDKSQPNIQLDTNYQSYTYKIESETTTDGLFQKLMSLFRDQ